MEQRAPCGCVRVGGGWNVSECQCPVREESLEVYRRICPILVVDGSTGAIISDFHPLQPEPAQELRGHARSRVGPSPATLKLEAFDEAIRDSTWALLQTSTARQGIWVRLLHEPGFFSGKTIPSEAEYVGRVSRITCRQDGRIWLVNALGEVQEVTTELEARRASSASLLQIPTRLAGEVSP